MSVSAAGSSIFSNWQDKHARLFDEQTIRVKHKLAETGLFTEEAIGRLIERCEPENYCVHTMGFDKNVLEWRAGEIRDLSGQQVIEAIRKGRMWMNIFRLMDRDPEYGKLLNQIMDEIEGRIPGLHMFKRNMSLLISSPNIQVYYHADIQGQSLWQLSGRKRVYVYPATEAFLSGESLEKIILRETEEEVPYEEWFDEYADVYQLEAGDMVHWPLYAPHRVENDDCLNISVTTEHWTRQIRKSFIVNFGNGVLRRTVGMSSPSRAPEGFHFYPKAAAAFAWKTLKIQNARAFKHKVDFRVDPSVPKGMVDIEPYFVAA